MWYFHSYESMQHFAFLTVPFTHFVADTVSIYIYTHVHNTYIGHSQRYKMIPHCSIYIFLISDVKNCSIYLWVICVSLFLKYLSEEPSFWVEIGLLMVLGLNSPQGPPRLYYIVLCMCSTYRTLNSRPHICKV